MRNNIRNLHFKWNRTFNRNNWSSEPRKLWERKIRGRRNLKKRMEREDRTSKRQWKRKLGKNENSDLEKERKGDQKGVETRQKEKQTKACLRILSPSRSISQKFRFEILVLAKKQNLVLVSCPFRSHLWFFLFPKHLLLLKCQVRGNVRASVVLYLSSFVNNNSRED